MNDDIQTLETTDYIVNALGGHGVNMANWITWRCVLRKQAPPRTFVPFKDLAVMAEINHGRWLANCPWCASAEMVSKVEPIFWCTECHNRAHDELPILVVFPGEMARIEEVLLARPDKRNRNWLPRETLGHLLFENFGAGIRLPEWVDDRMLTVILDQAT